MTTDRQTDREIDRSIDRRRDVGSDLRKKNQIKSNTPFYGFRVIGIIEKTRSKMIGCIVVKIHVLITTSNVKVQ